MQTLTIKYSTIYNNGSQQKHINHRVLSSKGTFQIKIVNHFWIRSILSLNWNRGDYHDNSSSHLQPKQKKKNNKKFNLR